MVGDGLMNLDRALDPKGGLAVDCPGTCQSETADEKQIWGVMQSPVTPLKDDYSLDLPTFEKVLDFHVRTGAPADLVAAPQGRVAQPHNR